jgi:hypothetical protein
VSDLKFVKGEEITATKLNRTVDRLPGAGPPGRPPKQMCAMFFTPLGGIPARSGTTLGSANCNRVTIGGLTLLTATSETERVVNLGTDAIGGSGYIQCLWIDGVWVANWEQC